MLAQIAFSSHDDCCESSIHLYDSIASVQYILPRLRRSKRRRRTRYNYEPDNYNNFIVEVHCGLASSFRMLETKHCSHLWPAVGLVLSASSVPCPVIDALCS
jgi:hypothetical protein